MLGSSFSNALTTAGYYFSSIDNWMDAWILSRMSEMVSKVNSGFDNYDLHEATRAIKTFWYTYLCDIYLEAVKPRLWNSNDLDSAHKVLSVLYTSCHTSLLVLAPFMPFISEEMYQRLPSFEAKCDSIMECTAPLDCQWKDFRNLPLEEQISQLVDVTAALRNLRKAFDIKSKTGGTGSLYIENLELKEMASSLKVELTRLSFLSEVSIYPPNALNSNRESAMNHVSEGISVQLHLQGLIDFEKEKARITYILHGLERKKQRVELKLARSQHCSFESEEKHRKKIEEISEKIRQYQDHLQKIKEMS